MEKKRSLKEVDLAGKRVLMRVDFNVPLDEAGKIRDDTRIRLSVPTIRYILSEGGRLILMSHLGRPKDQVDPALSLKVCGKRLSKILDQEVAFCSDCIGSEAKKMAENLKDGQVLLLENLRFHAAEAHPEKDPNFAIELGSLGEVYVNDAFGTAHRKHSSTYYVCEAIEGPHVAGFLMEKELEYLCGALQNPARPFYAIVGGAKVATKIGVLKSLANQVDGLFIGGAMAYTFLQAMGKSVGKSIVDQEHLALAKELVESCEIRGVQLHLPIDHVVARSLDDSEGACIVETIPPDMIGFDIGRQTLALWEEKFNEAKTIFWNGPVGVFERSIFAVGTHEIALYLSKSPAVTIVGGGDSVAAISALGLSEQFSHISTGGGASLELIEKGQLDGVECLDAATS